MSSRNRETRIVDAVVCPQCKAWRGSACFVKGAPAQSGHGGPFVHPARKEAWQAWKREQGIPDDPVEPTPRACPVCGTMCSSGRKAKDHCKAAGKADEPGHRPKA